MEEIIKLAQAATNYLDMTSYFPSLSPGFGEPDKLAIPKEWDKLVETIRFYYERDPIVSRVIDKTVDIAINDLHNNRGGSDEEVYEFYESLKPKILSFLKDAAREYLLSGLVIPEVILSVEQYKNGKVYTVPSNIWIRDPATIVVRKTPIPNRYSYYVRVDDDTVSFIINKGIYPDGTEDKETYELLEKNYPAFVKLVKSGTAPLIKFEPYFVIRRAQISGRDYPTPYILPILESLKHKRNLRKMDYSIASRVISAIQVIKMGNDKYPLTEADEDQLNDLKAQMVWRGLENNIERVFQLFGNHTLDISWVYPDTKAMLDNSKYQAVNQDIVFGLGFPRILVSGETDKSFTSSAEFAMFSPAESMKSIRNDLMGFVFKLYDDLAKYNGFEDYPLPELAPIRLYDMEKMTRLAVSLYDKASLSRTTLLGINGFDFEEEIENIAREREVMNKYNIPEFAPQPFSPQPSVPNSGDNEEEPDASRI